MLYGAMLTISWPEARFVEGVAGYASPYPGPGQECAGPVAPLREARLCAGFLYSLALSELTTKVAAKAKERACAPTASRS
jgi:hypothetical protein